jgi:phospholipid/cholesterol/gamma-HCH transport system substrate-binding protein
MRISNITKVGILVVATFAMLIWGISFLKGKNFFKQENEYYVIYDRVDGLSKSASVMLNGLKIGQVRSVIFDQKTTKIIVKFAIGEEFTLPDSTVAQIMSSDLMGTKAIDLTYGKSTKFHEKGDTLISAIEESLKDQVSLQMLPIKVKAESLMSSMDSVLAVIQSIFNEGTRANISQTFTSIKMTIENLEKTSVTLDTMLRNEKGKIGKIFSNIEFITYNLKNNNQHITNIITNFSTLSDSLAKVNISKTLTQADKALKNANEILTKINTGEGSMGMLLNNDTLYNNLESSAHSLNKLLDDMQKNPKRYVHFSMFDFGRSIQVTEGSKKVEKVKKKE